MHDFNCTDARDMNFELLAEQTRYLKENPEGVDAMCKVIEDMRREEREEGIQEGIEKGVKKTALWMLETGEFIPEKVASISRLSLEEVKELQAGLDI